LRCAACVKCPEYRFTPQDHSGSAAVGTVVNMAEASVRIRFQVNDLEIQQLPLDCPGGQRMAEKTLELIRKDGENSNSHVFIIAVLPVSDDTAETGYLQKSLSYDVLKTEQQASENSDASPAGGASDRIN